MRPPPPVSLRSCWPLGLLLAVLACSAEAETPSAPPTRSDSPIPAPGVSRAALEPVPPAPLLPVPLPPEPASEDASAPAATARVAKEEPAPENLATEASPSADGAALPPEPEREAPILVAAAREVFVYDRPSFDSKKLGYLRMGARVVRSEEAVAVGERCTGGFYRVSPAGYVCAGPDARLEAGDAVSQLARTRPDRDAPLPYIYGRSRAPAPPLYVKLPSAAETHDIEPEASRLQALDPAFQRLLVSAIPPELDGGRQLPTPWGHAYAHDLVSTGRALSDSAFAVLSVFEHEGRRFALTNDLLLVPLDRLKSVTPSRFHGLALDGAALPVAFVMRRGAVLYTGQGASRRPTRALEYREAIALSGRRVHEGGVDWLETQSGDFIRDDRLVRVDPLSALPPWAKGNRTWISVSITHQTLVAYEGARPVYVTLVSTGADGLGDPETTHSTVRGQFLIHTKHVSVTMDSDAVGDEYDLRDVPYVQYFRDGYALHAAYWHDAFGSPKSHGCINLAPLDARWLFRWTEPPVPPTWHGAFSLREGTLIDIES